MNYKKDTIFGMIKKFNVKLVPEEKLLEGKALLKVIMRKFLSASDSLLEMIVINLSSPTTTQCYCVDVEQIYILYIHCTLPYLVKSFEGFEEW